MTTDPAPALHDSCAKQADAGLDRLLADVLAARRAMVEELRIRPPHPGRQAHVRGNLLDSLESYASALSSRGLSPPPRLRDELSLQRRLASGR